MKSTRLIAGTFLFLVLGLLFLCCKQEMDSPNKIDSAEYKKTDIICTDEKIIFHTQDSLNQWVESSDKELNEGVKIVLFDEGIQRIPPKAFSCLSIYEVFFPSSLEKIEDHAFFGCEELELIHWKEGIKCIGDYSFKKTGVKELILPDGLTNIGYEAFTDMPNLLKAYLPDSVVKLSSSFSNCPKLESLQLSSSIEILHAGTLENTSLLNTLSIPTSVQIIDVDVAVYSGVRRIIFEGSPQLICRLRIKDYPALQQIVFCSTPPTQDTNLMNKIEDGELGIYGSEQCTLYYLNSFSSKWAPNGETEWNGFPIVGIDSLDDLPPLE